MFSANADTKLIIQLKIGQEIALFSKFLACYLVLNNLI